MLYDKYKQKMLNFKTALKKAFRHRFLIASILLFVLAFSSGLVIAKGSVYASPKDPGEFVYGEKITYDAKAFMSDIFFEYNVGGRWTTEAPTTVGNYFIRACSKGSFGWVKRGKERRFSIVPRPIDVVVSSEELIYGETPTVTGDFCYNDRVAFAEFVYENETIDGSNVTPIPETIVVVNTLGVNVTSCYTMQAQSLRVTTVKRPIEITVESAEKTYDGIELESSICDVTDGTMAYNDKLFATFDTSITDVGEVENVGVFTISNEEGVDVTHWYDISVVTGSLKINPRPITVMTGNAEGTYNGVGYYNGFFDIIGGDGLVNGQRMYSTNVPSLTDAGEIDNAIDVAIYNGYGTPFQIDQTHNYEITYQYGKITVYPRPVSILTKDYVFTYDGTDQSFAEYEETSQLKILEDHSVTTVNVTTIRNVGFAQNEFELLVSEGGRNVTANYEFTYTYGQLEMIKRRAVIVSENYSDMYDGEDLSWPFFSSDSVVDFHDVEVVDFTAIKNVGSTDNILTYVIYDGNEDVTSNYDLITQWGMLTVTKRPLTCVPQDVESVYNGNVHSATEIIVSPNSPYPCVEWHNIAGTFATGVENQRKYAGVSYSQISSLVITDPYNQDEDVTANYEITYEQGTITVYARTIHLKPATVSKTYDGDVLSASHAGIEDISTQPDQGLVDGDVIDGYTVVGEGGPDVGTYISRLVPNSIIILSNGTDIAHGSPASYNVVYVDGEIIIEKRPITVKPVDVSKIYDGTPLVATVWEWSENTQYRLAADHRIYTWEMSGSQTDVGQSESVVSNIIITTGDYSRIVTSNYEIITERGTITVTPRPITLKPMDTTFVYNGEEQSITRAVVAESSPYGLVLDHFIAQDSVNVTQGAGPNVGEYELSLVSGVVFICSGSGGDISCNYQISYETGVMTIVKREIHIKPEDVMKEYDGTPLTCNIAVAAQSSPNPLIPWHTITIVTDGSALNVSDGQVVNHITSFSITANGVDVSPNYTFVSCTGTLYVYHREITIKAGDATKVYDGTPLVCTNCFIVRGSLAHNQYFANITTSGSITDVGSAANVIDDEEIVIKFNGVDVTENYRIRCEEGVLTVTEREIMITTNSFEWVYDGEEHSLPTYQDPIYIGPYEGELPPALVLDHHLEVETYSTIINAGSISNNMTFLIKDGGDVVKNSNYIITVNTGTLTVTPIELTVRTASGEWTYDGTLHSNDTFYYVGDNRPLSGHTLFVVEDTGVLHATVEPVRNVLRFYIIDENGISCTMNYVVNTVEYGTLVVLPRAIKIQTASYSWTYTGADLYDRRYWVIEGDLAQGDYIEVVSSTMVKNVTLEPVLNEFHIIIKQGTSNPIVTTRDYVILWDYGELEVTPLAVTLKPQDHAEYNGEEQSAVMLVATDSTNLVIGHVATALTEELRVDVGNYVANIVDGTVVIRDATGVNVTANYVITTSEGTFEITPRILYIIAEDSSKVYDGTPLTYDGYTFENLLTSIHTVVSVDVVGEITDVGTEYNVPSNAVIHNLQGEPINMNNYDIRYVNGTLRVTPIIIEFVTGSEEKRFDGEPLSNTDYEIVSGDFLDGHVLSIKQSAYITYPGSKANNMQFIVSSEDGSIDYTRNYKFTNLAPGILKVTPIRVTVVTGSATKYYDGTPLTCLEKEVVIEGDPIPTHEILVDVTGTITDPGETPNVFDFVVMYNGVDVTKGYEVTAAWGELVVLEKIKVNLKPQDENKAYDGTPLVASVLEGFEPLEELGYYYENLVFGGSQTDYGVSESWIENIDIYDSEGNPIDNTIEMFDLTYEEGELKVTKIQVIIRLFDVSKYYDGTPISYYEDDYIVVDSKGLTLDIRLGGELTNVGKLTYDEIREASIYHFYDAYGNDVTDNYYLEIVGNPLEVKARQIEVRSIDASKVYDGEELSSGRAWVSQGSLVQGHVISFTITSTITHVGFLENKIDEIVIMSEGVDVTQNYDITEIYGILVVEPME